MTTRTFFLALCLAAPSFGARSEILDGRVVGVSDGDTLTVRVARRELKVRVGGIDAPEWAQAYGKRSKQNLSAMALQKDARLECHKTNRYGQEVCKVWVQPFDCPTCGKTLDVGLAQIVAGLAWWYRDYAKEQGPEDQGRYESSEREARLRKLGLWSAPYPVPPWDWRTNERDRKGSLPSPVDPVAPEPPRPVVVTPQPEAPIVVVPPKPFCDRKDVPGENRADIVCGWR